MQEDKKQREKAVKELGIEHLSEKDQDVAFAEFGKRATFAMTNMILELIPKDKRAEYEELAEKGDLEALNEFVQKHVPDIKRRAEHLLASERINFRNFFKLTKESK